MIVKYKIEKVVLLQYYQLIMVLYLQINGNMILNYKKMVDGQLPCVSQNIVKVIYQKDGVMEEKLEIKMDKVLKIY